MNTETLKNKIINTSHYSQLGQEIFVLDVLKNKRFGYFVEFGATDGKELSNTLLLENTYGWNGVLSEPARAFRDMLKYNRSCSIDDKCVYIKSNEVVEFVEVGWVSTMTKYINSDFHGELRSTSNNRYNVETITLDDLLNKYSAPAVIDYLSMDTEGSEFDILNTYSFDRHINIITVEHNYSGSREKIYNLLTKRNFMRVHEEISDFDDWYVNKTIV